MRDDRASRYPAGILTQGVPSCLLRGTRARQAAAHAEYRAGVDIICCRAGQGLAVQVSIMATTHAHKDNPIWKRNAGNPWVSLALIHLYLLMPM